MKALDIFIWSVDNGISEELLYWIDVPKEASDEWWELRFGFHPKQQVEEGGYIGYYMSEIHDVIKDDFDNVIEPYAKIENCDTEDIFLLYKVED